MGACRCDRRSVFETEGDRHVVARRLDWAIESAALGPLSGWRPPPTTATLPPHSACSLRRGVRARSWRHVLMPVVAGWRRQIRRELFRPAAHETAVPGPVLI